MKVGVPKESAPDERRVALVPDGVRRLVESGVDVVVEQSAGAEASFLDDAFAEAGAEVAKDAYSVDVVCKVQRPSAGEVEALREGQTLIGLLQPLQGERPSGGDCVLVAQRLATLEQL